MKRKIVLTLLVLVLAFVGWRMIRPMQIFVVSPAFERPVDTRRAPAMFPTLRAAECGGCHRDILAEWSTTIHSQAWTDPYFQVDWKFDGSPQICKNCHIPLDRQQAFLVTGFHDDEKWDPVLEPNPAFDAELQHEGVTCTACHLRAGRILGVRGDTDAPHPVEKIGNGNEVCIRCHVVSGKRWDTFFRFPPCGTVAEIKSSRKERFVETAEEMSGEEIAALGCVDCHMPLTERPLVAAAAPRQTRRHLWRGGHDPETVKNGLTIDFRERLNSSHDRRTFVLSLSNTGAAHYIPTGTPDRHLTVRIRAMSENGEALAEQAHILKRTVMWRPFIIDLRDTRLPPGERRHYELELDPQMHPAYIEASVDYHLLDEARRVRIGYNNTTPIRMRIFQQKLMWSGR